MRKAFAVILLLVPAFAFAEKEPKAVVQEIFEKASVPAVATDSKKQDEVNAMVDFETLAKAALGKNSKGVPAEEIQWFKNTLQEIITRTVYPKAPEFLQGVKIRYNEVEAKGEKAKVKSSVQNKADLTDVDYELGKKKNSEWKVVDVAIAGQSWVESIRDQVSQVIKKKKWKGLKEAMNRRLNELKGGKG